MSTQTEVHRNVVATLRLKPRPKESRDKREVIKHKFQKELVKAGIQPIVRKYRPPAKGKVTTAKGKQRRDTRQLELDVLYGVGFYENPVPKMRHEYKARRKFSALTPKEQEASLKRKAAYRAKHGPKKVRRKRAKGAY